MLKFSSRHFACLFINLGLLLYVGCITNDVPEYGNKLIVSVEWGAKAGKFGLAIPEEGEIIGPRTFAIDVDGDIHIFDSVKRNIKVFDGNGVFKGSIGKDLPGYSFVVHRKNYYLLDGETVYQYTVSGIPQKSYPIAQEINLHEGYGQWMQIDGNGYLYVKSQGWSYRIAEGTGEKNTVLSREAQIGSARRGAPNSQGTHWFVLSKESSRRFRLRIYDKGGNPVNEFPVETSDIFGSVLFLDTDEKGIIYLEAKRIGSDGVAHLEVRKYKANGKLIQGIEFPNRYYTKVYKKIVVDKKGALYQFQTSPSGVQVVRWSK